VKYSPVQRAGVPSALNDNFKMRIVMKYRKIFTGIVCIVFFSLTGTVYAGSMVEVEKNGDKFKSDVISALSLNSNIGLSWSDAYIGQLLSVKPHFGIGVSGGLTSSNVNAFRGILGSIGVSEGLVNEKSMMLPSLLVEARLGGIVLPFDLGFKFGKLDDISIDPLNSGSFTRSFFIIGGDVRYALSKGGVFFPKISLGFAYTYLSGTFNTKIEGDKAFDIDSTHKLNMNSPEAALFWEMNSLDMKLQVSKTFFFITPYLGLGATFYWASAGYKVDAPTALNGTPVNNSTVQTINSLLRSNNINGISISPDGFSADERMETGMVTRAFGGFSLDFFVFRLDLNALCDFPALNYGASLGFRIQV
jgi:hypothetical protein